MDAFRSSFIAGIRPRDADVYYMRPPGWMLDRGWALTAEVGGITERDGAGPHRQPSVAWIRGRSGAADLIIGGRHLGAAGDPPARLTLAGDRGPVDSWEISPGFFFRRIAVPAGVLDGSACSPFGSAAPRLMARAGWCRSRSSSSTCSRRHGDVRVRRRLARARIQPEDRPDLALDIEQARLWIRPIGRDVVLTLTGESPLKDFDKAPAVRVSAAGAPLAQFAPSSDFTQRITIPAKALSASGGVVTVDTELWFSPAERSGSPDKRHLGLRVYAVRAE